jgi:predicted ferric reductase
VTDLSDSSTASGRTSQTPAGKPGPRLPFGGILLVVAYVALLCSPLVVAGLMRPRTQQSFLWELGKSFALVGVVVLVLQFVLAARLRGTTRHFGLDAVLRFHRGMAILAVVLIALHPVLLALGGGGWSLLTSVRMPWYIWLGKTALLLLVIQALAALLRRTVRLSFETWRGLHNQALVILALVLLHSWVAGTDLRHRPMQALWLGLFTAAVSIYAYHKLCVPWQGRRRAYRVSDVQRETHNTWSLTLKPPQGTHRFPFLPGQFHFVSLYRGDRYDGEEHPFTISSGPLEHNVLRSTIKASGDFTSTVGNTRPGDRVRVQGPFGRFSHLLHPEETDLVFIAGGIGITPLMSMLRYMRDTDADLRVLLLYGNRTEEDIVFGEELEAMARLPASRLKVVHVLSNAALGWDGERGYIDQECILRHCGEEVSRKAFYICGPPPMMDLVSRALRSLGVPADGLHSERFSL